MRGRAVPATPVRGGAVINRPVQDEGNAFPLHPSRASRLAENSKKILSRADKTIAPYTLVML